VALDPACLSKRAKLLVNAGRYSGLGCRYAGHGHGGCVWAIGEEDIVAIVEKGWHQIARNWKDAWVIRPKVAPGLLYSE
jgi:D-glycero-alpha-D-manno-heptose-7-phosphate kinase